jgi:putative endopeptidase
LSGVSLALRAFQLYRGDHPRAQRDEREELRALFGSWARIWAYKAPENAIRFIVANSYYVPNGFLVKAVWSPAKSP